MLCCAGCNLSQALLLASKAERCSDLKITNMKGPQNWGPLLIDCSYFLINICVQYKLPRLSLATPTPIWL